MNRREWLSVGAGAAVLATLGQGFAADSKEPTSLIKVATLRKNLQDQKIYAVWDFNTAEGETILEKYESLYSLISEISKRWKDTPLCAIVAAPPVSSIFETATAGFAPISSSEWELNKDSSCQKVGTVNNRWDLYKDQNSPSEIILADESLKSGILIHVVNFFM